MAPGRGVGIDVVGELVVDTEADRRHHGNDVGAAQLLQHHDVDLGGLADLLEVDLEQLAGLGIAHLGDLAGEDQVAVLAADADGDAAAFVDVGHDRLVDRAGQDHLDDLHGRRIGHAQAVHEGAFQPDALQHLADLRAAAMDHDGVHADLLHQHDVARHEVAQLRIGHGVAAILHDEGGVVVPAHVGQRLGDGLRHADEPPLLPVGGLNRVGHFFEP